MITIVCGLPRKGKTILLAHLATCEMFNWERIRNMHAKIDELKAGGFNLSKPRHPVVANFDIVGHKFRYTPRLSRKINPYRLGYHNERVDVHFLPPFSVVFITEGQKYLDSRMSTKGYPEWQSRWYEQHGHNDLDIYIDVQRFDLIDKNIRELASVIEIESVEFKDGKTIWQVRTYANHKAHEAGVFEQKTVIADYDVRRNYDHQSCKPKHYEVYLHIPQDFELTEHEPLEHTVEGYKRKLLMEDDEYPAGFYGEKIERNRKSFLS